MIGLVPFRMGSKRVKDKPIKQLNGKPLVWWTLKAAEESKLEVYYITSDYNEMELQELIDFDEFPKMLNIKRPEYLATNDSPATGYIDHFLNLPENQKAKSICLLQPTCPLRLGADIDNAISLYEGGCMPTLVSAYEIYRNYLYDYKFESIYGTRLNKEEIVYHRNSSIYIFDVDFFRRHLTIFSKQPIIYKMPLQRSIDINTEDDFRHCEALLKGGII